MKKHLLIAVLTLAIITSLTAGTLAAYTQDLGTHLGNVRTKTFHITSTAGGAFAPVPSALAALKMAPGDTVYYKMEVKNDAEATADIVATADLKNNLGGRLLMSIVNESKDLLGGTSYTFNNVASTESRIFYVKLYWPYSTATADNAKDSDNEGKAVSFTLNMNAISTDMKGVFGDT